jgi:phosphoribosylformylglycinamidine synthase
MMPHPEAALFFTQLPDWVRQKEEAKRKGQTIPDIGPGLALFKNAVNYLRNQ